MSDYRGRRQDSRPQRDDYDRQDHRDSGRDRRPYRSRSREDRRGHHNYDRSRSPDSRHNRDGGRRGGGRGGQRGRDRDYYNNNNSHSRRYDDRDRRRDRDRDHHDYSRSQRSASPQDSGNSSSRYPSDHGSLPSRPREDDAPPAKPSNKNSRRDNNKDEPESMDEDGEVDDEEAAMQAMMGFSGFNSTKGKKVAGNNAGAVRKEKKTEYRQYMNRQGGFNRPLSPSR